MQNIQGLQAPHGATSSIKGSLGTVLQNLSRWMGLEVDTVV